MDRARPLRGPPPGVQAGSPRPTRTASPWGPQLRLSQCGPGKIEIPFAPQSCSLLITRAVCSTKSYSPALGSCPDTCALPGSRLGLAKSKSKSRTPPPHPTPATPRHALGVREREKRGKEPGSSISPKTAHWMLLNHMTLPGSHRFEPKKLAISCHST